MVRQEQKCYLCNCNEHQHRPGKVRDDASFEILECQHCGLVFLSRSELPEGFYEQSGMHGDELLSVQEWLREGERDNERRNLNLSDAMANRDILDFGCGAGGFLLKARAKARTVMGVELESRLQPHYQTNQLDVVRDIDSIPADRRFDLVTAFHVIEHLEDPAAILRKLAARLRNDGHLIIEVPSAADVLLTLYESESFSKFTYWSCHLYLFNAGNLPLLAKKAGLKVDFISHLQRYPLSNHLHWLAKGKPGGHQSWGFLDSDDLSRAYEARLAALGVTDTLLAGLSC